MKKSTLFFLVCCGSILYIIPSLFSHEAEGVDDGRTTFFRDAKMTELAKHYQKNVRQLKNILDKQNKKSIFQRSPQNANDTIVIVVAGMPRVAWEIFYLVQFIINSARPLIKDFGMASVGQESYLANFKYQLVKINGFSKHWEEKADYIFTAYQDIRTVAAFEKYRNDLPPEMLHDKLIYTTLRSLRFYNEWAPYSDLDICDEDILPQMLPLLVDEIKKIIDMEDNVETFDVVEKMLDRWKTVQPDWHYHEETKYRKIMWEKTLDTEEVSLLTPYINKWLMSKHYQMEYKNGLYSYPKKKLPPASDRSLMVIAAGGRFSGDVWLFNAIKLIMEEVGFMDINSGWQNADKFCAFRKNCIVKIFNYHQPTEERANFVFTSHRNLKEVWALWDKNHPLEQDSIKTSVGYHNGWQPYSDYELAYEDIIKHPEREIKIIAQTMGFLKINSGIIAEKLATLDNELQEEVDWKKKFTSKDSEFLSSEYGDWILEQGYKDK